MVFCVRDENGDLIYAEYQTIEETTSTQAGAVDLLQASKHYNSVDN